MDLYTLLVAAHWHTHEQRLRGARESHSTRAGAVHQEVRIYQALTPSEPVSSTWAQPRRAASGIPRGRRASRRATAGCCSGRCTLCPAARGEAHVYVPSMHVVGKLQREWASATSQSVGSLPVFSWRRFAQRDTTACLAPGASFSSLHEWLRKAVTSPIAAGTVLAASSVALVLVDLPQAPSRGSAPSPARARSAAISWLAGRHRSSFAARSSVHWCRGSCHAPTSAATAAASSALVPRPPRRPRRRWMRPRLRGVARAAHKRETTLTATNAKSSTWLPSP
eukprot:scaffold14653_cov66-Phaeocystis_antarctica.AAC.4